MEVRDPPIRLVEAGSSERVRFQCEECRARNSIEGHRHRRCDPSQLFRLPVNRAERITRLKAFGRRLSQRILNNGGERRRESGGFITESRHLTALGVAGDRYSLRGLRCVSRNFCRHVAARGRRRRASERDRGGENGLGDAQREASLRIFLEFNTLVSLEAPHLCWPRVTRHSETRIFKADVYSSRLAVDIRAIPASIIFLLPLTSSRRCSRNNSTMEGDQSRPFVPPVTVYSNQFSNEISRLEDLKCSRSKVSHDYSYCLSAFL